MCRGVQGLIGSSHRTALHERLLQTPAHLCTPPAPALWKSIKNIVHECYNRGVVDPRALRLAAGVSQAELAERLGWEQPRVSRFERQTDWKLSTLADYLVALGVEAELVLRLPNKKKITQPLTEGENP